MSGFAGSSWRRAIFPPVCLACEKLTDTDNRICSTCKDAICNEPHFTCPKCSSTVGEFQDVSAGCPRCRDQRFKFDEATRLGPYDGVLRDAVLKMKAASSESLAETIGCHFARSRLERLRAWGGELVVPVPLHWWRRLLRGYNQSEAIALGFGSVLGLPVRSGCLRRIRWTRKQFELTPTQREENVKGAFKATAAWAVQGKRVILIDDVMTTGRTLHECAKELKNVGAAWVGAAILAHR